VCSSPFKCVVEEPEMHRVVDFGLDFSVDDEYLVHLDDEYQYEQNYYYYSNISSMFFLNLSIFIKKHYI
jgi:hypothetical protein